MPLCHCLLVVLLCGLRSRVSQLSASCVCVCVGVCVHVKGSLRSQGGCAEEALWVLWWLIGTGQWES